MYIYMIYIYFEHFGLICVKSLWEIRKYLTCNGVTLGVTTDSTQRCGEVIHQDTFSGRIIGATFFLCNNILRKKSSFFLISVCDFQCLQMNSCSLGVCSCACFNIV